MAVFNEDTRVKIPATIQFLRLGYDYQSLKDIDLHKETRIAINRFKPAIERINERKFSDEEIYAVLDEIHTVLKYNDMGKAFYKWLITPDGKVKLIDFENIEKNDYAVVDELFYGPQEKGSFRPDINILINGIPLAFLEVKKPNNPGGIQAEFKRMLNDRLEVPEYRKYFNMLQIVSFSNNMPYESDDDSVSADAIRAGSFYTTPNGKNTNFSFFRDERPRISGFEDVTLDRIRYVLKDNKYSPSVADTPEFQTNLEPSTPCNAFVSSLFSKDRLMYLLYYGIFYVDYSVPEKHIMRYPQFFASQAILKRLEDGGKSGIIFHTQGSGKTELGGFSVRIIRDYYAKKGITARFYYVVDRIELLVQVSNEMSVRGLSVINVDSKKDFEKELNKALPTTVKMDSNGEITVVNIQKFTGKMPEARNDYNANIQRIFFIDEAHRSYRLSGEFFKNLMVTDRDAVYIAMTGTPLLSKKERSSLKFGDYIHRYFYDKSIADGYTLRIKKESIETTARSEIRANLDLDNPDVDKRAIMESPDYINALGKYITQDFEFFRLTNCDNTIGGMIVCCSNEQARKLKAWFDEKNELSAGLVISDENILSATNKATQLAFKNTLEPDILIVNQMLTTGYDVRRLKKMYLLRNAKEHNLLQTVSRVNRPYRNPFGRTYEFGYIVDFVDIQEEYDRTIAAYLKELEDDFNEDSDEHSSLSGLIISPEDIDAKYHALKKELDGITDITNLEKFAASLTYLDKDKLYFLRKLLTGIKNCHTEFLLSRADQLAQQIDSKHIQGAIKEVQNRIDFLNLSGQPVDLLAIISNKQVCEILYEFFKVRVSVMDMGKLPEYTKKFEKSQKYNRMKDIVTQIQEAIKQNKNRGSSEMVKLDELLKKIFEALNIDNMDEINEQLKEILDRIRAINEENEKLAKRYDGNYSFVKTYQDACEVHPDINKEDIAKALDIIYGCVKEIQSSNVLVLQGREVFTASVKRSVSAPLLKSGLYKKLKLKDWLNDLLGEIYMNLKKF